MKRAALATISLISVAVCVLLAGCASNARSVSYPVNSLTAVSSPPPPWSYPCTPEDGAGCSPPQPITRQLWTDAVGRTINGLFACGGTLVATETATQVALTYRQQLMMPGAMACAFPILTARLASPLGTRMVVDATTGGQLPVAPSPPASPWAAPPTDS